MTLSILKNRLLNEIELLPEDKLTDLYNVIHYFRLGAEKNKGENDNDLLSFSGSWNDMNDEIFNDYLLDITKMRNRAFRDRRNDETITY